MGQPRAAKRRVVTISSDEEDSPPERPVGELSQDGEPPKPQKRSARDIEIANKPRGVQQPTPVTSTPGPSSQKLPSKSKTTKTQRKTATKDALPANSKTIYSFFNAATQRQQLSQASASPGKLTRDQPEAIHDDSDDAGGSVAISKGSSTALAVRKRKAQYETGLHDSSGLASSATQKFRKTGGGGRVPSPSAANENRRTWTERFAPVDLTELAVHKRKVADVRQWLETAISSKRRKVLVLKGAAGTGKTTTVRLLAKDLGINVSEWQNPTGADMSAEGSLTTAGHFEEFVRRAGRSPGLSFTTGDDMEAITSYVDQHRCDSENGAKQILLVEEFPNTFSRTSAILQSFRSTILQYVSSPAVQEGKVTPIVMIISETLLSTSTAAADSFTAHRFLGPELVNHPLINTIEFNSVASTILTKALESIVVKEARISGRRKTPGPHVLKRLAETGDIRSAVSSLEFLCLRGDDTEAWSSKVQFTKPKKKPTEPAMTKAEEHALKLVSNRESSLGIFHAVGRVLYNNRVDPPSGQPLAQPPPWLPQYRRAKIPEREVDSLIDELGTETSTFIAALHENYALSCTSSSAADTMDSLLGCADSISDADLLSVDRFSFGTRAFAGSAIDSIRQDEMAFQVAVRGILFNLPHPVHRSAAAGGNKADAHRMVYPTSLKLWKQKEEIEGMLDLLTTQTQSGYRGSAYMQKSSARGDGVESWTRNTSFGQPVDEGAIDESRGALSTVTKTEMLLEHLPYLAKILASREHTFEPSALLRQATLVSRVRGQATSEMEDADAEKDEDDAAGRIMSWSTDNPNLDMDTSKSKPKSRDKGKQKVKTEGGGLAIPVETRVERLVLEDDDIVDV